MTIDTLEQGLFKFDFTDYHAILGVSLEADPKEIRKRYLKIARKLHPDSLRAATEADKQQASELLSKMVNPAYEHLTQEKLVAEHKVVLRMRGQQLSRQVASLDLKSDAARSLVGSHNPVHLYETSLKQLAEEQYESLETVLEKIGQISELNLAYLVSTTQGGTGAASAAPTPAAPPESAPAAATATAPPPPSPRQHRAAIIESYLNRAREFEQKKDFSRAIIEMRDAVRVHPHSAVCHGQLASLYLQSGQPKMARIHLKRALDIDPEEPLAKQLQPKINRLTQGRAGQQKTAAKSKSRGGLFGLFGGKQK